MCFPGDEWDGAERPLPVVTAPARFRSPQKTRVLSRTVQTIRLRHGRIHRFSGPRPRRIQGFLTVPQIAQAIDVNPHWLYHLINRNVIQIERNTETRMYLFPDRPGIIQKLIHLRDGKINKVSI